MDSLKELRQFVAIHDSLEELRQFVAHMHEIEVPEELESLIEEALNAPPIENVEEWAAQLAEDICRP